MSDVEFVPRNKEFFECDCYSKGDLIRAEYSINTITFKDGYTHNNREISIIFETNLSEYDQIGISEKFFSELWTRIKWRIKYAFKILISGEIKTEGYFLPCRSLVDSNKNKVENLFGYQTTKNLAKWLDTKADEIKADYEIDLLNYESKQNIKPVPPSSTSRKEGEIPKI